jgi:hypothetical protein
LCYADGNPATETHPKIRKEPRWAAHSLAWAHDLGLVEGYNDPDRGKLLCPGENVERQRAATVLARAFTMGVLK